MRILLVDDSRAMRLIVARCLRGREAVRHTIEEAASGPAALAAILASPPDLILCDWHMPDMSGLQLLEALRAAGCTVTFGFVTADDEPETRAQALAAGASFLLAKPFTPDAFRDVVSPFLT